jgi:hypothetical protein
MALVQSQQITGSGLGNYPGPLLRLGQVRRVAPLQFQTFPAPFEFAVSAESGFRNGESLGRFVFPRS